MESGIQPSESGIQPSESRIHDVESGIRDSLGFLYRGRKTDAHSATLSDYYIFAEFMFANNTCKLVGKYIHFKNVSEQKRNN